MDGGTKGKPKASAAQMHNLLIPCQIDGKLLTFRQAESAGFNIF
jgi:hypothetical protein